MAKKFIPNGDLDFAHMASFFTRALQRQEGHFGIAHDDVQALAAAVALYQEKLRIARLASARSTTATAEKESARQEAEKILRRIVHLLRLNESLTVSDRIALGMRERGSAGKTLTVPNEPPRLKFVRAIHEGHAIPKHELSFMAADFRKGRPEGAVRLELFCDLVPPDEKIPAFPGANGVRPFYLRSYTKSPILLTPPMPTVAMRVVYWARWADALGNVGPFCSTAVGWTEGGTHHLMQGMVAVDKRYAPPKQIEVTQESSQAAIAHQTMVFVALLEAQRRSIDQTLPALDAPHGITQRELPAPEESGQRQLEGPDTPGTSLEAA